MNTAIKSVAIAGAAGYALGYLDALLVRRVKQQRTTH